MRPLGLRRKNHSFFCSFVLMLIMVVVHSVPYVSASSSSMICNFCPLGVDWVIRWRPLAFLTLSGVSAIYRCSAIGNGDCCSGKGGKTTWSVGFGGLRGALGDKKPESLTRR